MAGIFALGAFLFHFKIAVGRCKLNLRTALAQRLHLGRCGVFFMSNFFKKKPDLGNVNQDFFAHFEKVFGKEEADRERAEIARQKAERDAMPRNDEWLLSEIYTHVVWHEHGSGKAMGYYADMVKKRWNATMSAAETEALKRELIGY